MPTRRTLELIVVAVVALGMTLGALPHIAAGRPAGVTGMSARLLAVAFVALSGHNEAYYSDYLGRATEWLAASKFGFIYQGQWSQRQKKPRGRSKAAWRANYGALGRNFERGWY